jgi:coronin-1B/1C/6
MRAYKTVNDTYIEPISFTVPRRAETFQADIFPPAFGSKPAVSAQDWLQGKTGVPSKVDFESIYEGNAPKEVASDYRPPQKIEPVSAPKATPREEPKPAPVVRSPPPTMSEQKASINAMANKYQDNEEDEEEEDDETSSFEEISKPPQRAQAATRSADPPKSTAVPKVQAPAASATAAAASSPVKASPPAKSPIGTSTPTQQAPTSFSSGSVEGSLDQIKQLIESQTKLINSQNEQLSLLVNEVETLKKKVGSGSGSQDQSERIRQLELELEEARS